MNALIRTALILIVYALTSSCTHKGFRTPLGIYPSETKNELFRLYIKNESKMLLSDALSDYYSTIRYNVSISADLIHSDIKSLGKNITVDDFFIETKQYLELSRSDYGTLIIEIPENILIRFNE